MIKTTKEQFQLFKKECEKWIKFWGLTEWSMYYYHEKLGSESFAQCCWNLNGRVASITLNTHIDEDKNQWDYKKSAFHEVCELLLSELDGLIRDRFVSKSHIDIAFHAVIRRLENCVLKELM